MDLKKYNLVERKAKYLVSGYIRKTQNIFPSNIAFYNIPSLVIQICTLFYFIGKDKWSKEYSHKNFEINGNILTKIKGNSYSQHTAFLNKIVYDGKHHWKFKLIKWEAIHLMIGIWKNNVKITSDVMNSYPGKSKNTAYIFYAGYGCINNHDKHNSYTRTGDYGIQCSSTGTVIDMFIDFDELELSFSVNGIHYGVSHHIDPGKYRGVVSFENKENQIELISYNYC